MEKVHVERGHIVDVMIHRQGKNAILIHPGFGAGTDGLPSRIYLGMSNPHSTFLYTPDRPVGKLTEVLPLEKQAEILTKIWDSYCDEFNFEAVIGHSLGCLVIALARLPIKRCILLAPPMINPYEGMLEYFDRSYSALNPQGNSIIPRSNGSFTFTRKAVWDSLQNIYPVRLYELLAEKSEVTLVHAERDEVITDSIDNFPTRPSLTRIVISHADHNFTHREDLVVKTIQEAVNS